MVTGPEITPVVPDKRNAPFEAPSFQPIPATEIALLNVTFSTVRPEPLPTVTAPVPSPLPWVNHTRALLMEVGPLKPLLFRLIPKSPTETPPPPSNIRFPAPEIVLPNGIRVLLAL